VKTKIYYPLLENAFDKKDIELGVKVIKSKQLTMSKITRNFEKTFSKYLGVKYAVMVNSGSSANLLSLFVAKYSYKFKSGDEIIIPTICWSTSLWPIIQAGLKPVFVDVNLKDFNASLEEINLKINKKTKAILLVHVLGTSLKIDNLLKITKSKNILIIEDSCESLGSKYKNKYLGTFGEFSSFSFYSSHQISSGEGGMICCKNNEDYNIIKSLRSHGWSRGTSFENKIYKNNQSLDKRFIFFNSGYNLRPTEVSAAIGYNQFKKLDKLIKTRLTNRNKIINSILNNQSLKLKIGFFRENKNVKASWFGIPIKLLKNIRNKRKIINNLERNGIETRPIISGNFAKQPACIKYGLSVNKKFPKTDIVYNKSFFIGLPTKKIGDKFLNKLIFAFEKSFK